VPVGVQGAQGLADDGGALYAYAGGVVHRINQATGAYAGAHQGRGTPVAGDATAVSDLRVYTDANKATSVWGRGWMEDDTGTTYAVEPPSLDIAGAAWATDAAGEYGLGEYAIDAAGDQLVRLVEEPFRWGGEHPIAFEPLGPLGLDVPLRPVGFEAIKGVGYLASGGILHRVDLDTGAAQAVGPIGNGRAVRDLALVRPARIAFYGPPYGDHFEIVNERDGENATIRVYRWGDPETRLDFTLHFSATPGPYASVGSAEAHTDFVPVSRRVVIPPHTDSVEVSIPVIDDDAVEPKDAIWIRVDDDDMVRGAVHVSDDDTEFHATGLSASEAAGSAAVLVERDDAGRPTTVDLQTGGGTASAGEDYKAVATRVEFVRGEKSKVVNVPLVDDGTAEPDETVALRLSAPTVTRFVNPRRAATLTIRSDDALDPRAPTARVLLSKFRLRRTVRVPFSCSEACAARVELRVDQRTAKRLRVPRRVASTSMRSARAGRTSARLRIARRTLVRLRRARKVRMTARLVAADAAGNAQTAVRVVTARR
jgi:hypothetical protein